MMSSSDRRLSDDVVEAVGVVDGDYEDDEDECCDSAAAVIVDEVAGGRVGDESEPDEMSLSSACSWST